MKAIFGLLLILAGIVLGFYVGGWLMFVGGIIQVIEALKATPIDSFEVAVGALKFVCSSAVGIVCSWLCIIPGVGCIQSWMRD